MNPYRNTAFDLSGLTALIPGGGRGRGKEMARIFAQTQADLLWCSGTKPPARSRTEETGRHINYLE